MASLFISYSRRDIERARQLTEALKTQNRDYWIDWEGIEPTLDWWLEIEKGIEEADNFLFLLSPDSVESDVCLREITHAVRNGKRLIPVVIRDVQLGAVPAELRALNWIFLREQDHFETAFDRLLNAIMTDYGWVQFHRRLQVKALEWERDGHEHSLLLRGRDLADAESQLARNMSTEPRVTDLQRDYVRNSRQAENKQRRTVMSIAALGLVALVGLATFGFMQAGTARKAAATAMSNEALAATERANALAEASGRATAQVDAEMNEQLAEERAKIALARRLASQAQSIRASRSSREMIAVLLAVQSMKILPSAEAAQILQESRLAAPIARVAHQGYVSTVAFSPDGKYVVSGSEDGTIRVWEAMTGQEIVLMTHEDEVTSSVFSPDGKYVVSASLDDTARVWDAMTGEEISRMVHGRMVNSVAFSPDGRCVLTGSLDGTARIWDALTGTEITRITSEDSYMWSVAFSPSGDRVVSSECYKLTNINQICTEYNVRIWDAATGEEIARMSHDRWVQLAIFSPDGRLVLSASWDRTARIWNAETGEEIARVTHEDRVSTVAFSTDGKHAVSGGRDNTARIWEVATGREIARIVHDSPVISVAVSPDGKYVASGSDDFTVRVSDLFTGKEVSRMTHEDWLQVVAFSPDSQYIVSAGHDQTARTWKLFTEPKLGQVTFENLVMGLTFSRDRRYLAGVVGKTMRILDLTSGEYVAVFSHDDDVNFMAFSPDGDLLASASEDGTARVWEAATGEEITRMTHDEAVESVAFSPDGQLVVSGSDDSTVRVWDALTGREVNRMAHEEGVLSVSFDPEGDLVVSGGKDDAVRVWDLSSGAEILRLEHQSWVNSSAFSPEGKHIVSASDDGTARVWDVRTGQEIARMTHDKLVSDAAISPDGKYVLSGSYDHTARVWNALTGEEVARMKHDSMVLSVSFSLDGKFVVSEPKNGKLLIWFYLPEHLIANACLHVTRNLNREEWAQYIRDALPYEPVCLNLPAER